jgi:hypothetical protein
MQKNRKGKWKTGFLWLLMAVVLALGVIPVTSFVAEAGTKEATYIDDQGVEQSQADFTVLNEEYLKGLAGDDTSATAVTLNAGWYLVEGTTDEEDDSTKLTSPYNLVVSGEVNLILADDTEMICDSKRIDVSEGNSLTIYGQKKKTGKLTVTSSYVYASAIGSGQYKSSGTITINGGEVTAINKSTGAAIGCGGHGACENIEIRGGKVTAINNGSGAAIGGGDYAAGGTITITEGTVEATATWGAAIGGGGYAAGGITTIKGGTVKAENSGGGAAIGGGGGGAGGTITIESGTVTAISSGKGAAIGGGVGNGNAGGAGETITIKSGTVTAISSGEGAAIGGGGGNGNRGGAAGNITITGGTVAATNSGSGQGIGYGVGGKGNGATGTFTTGENGTAVIFASSISSTSYQSDTSTKGMIFVGNTGKVYGDSYTLAEDLEISSGKTLNIDETVTLTIPEKLTLENNGTIKLYGTIKNNGTITNNGDILYAGSVEKAADTTFTNNGTISIYKDTFEDVANGESGKIRYRIKIADNCSAVQIGNADYIYGDYYAAKDTEITLSCNNLSYGKAISKWEVDDEEIEDNSVVMPEKIITVGYTTTPMEHEDNWTLFDNSTKWTVYNSIRNICSNYVDSDGGGWSERMKDYEYYFEYLGYTWQSQESEPAMDWGWYAASDTSNVIGLFCIGDYGPDHACEITGAEDESKLDRMGGKLTLSTPDDLVYDGNSKPVKITTDEYFESYLNAALNSGELTKTITYAKKDGNGNYVALDEGAFPTEVGDYRVTYKLMVQSNADNEYDTVSGTETNSGTETYSAYVDYSIEKATVERPEMKSVPYNGKTQTAELDTSENALYNVSQNEGGIDVGEYEVVLKLKDSANYKWADAIEDETAVDSVDETAVDSVDETAVDSVDETSDTITLTFEITQAENKLRKESEITEWTYDAKAKAPECTADFGELKVKYQKGSEDLDSAPVNAGSYSAIYTVEETPNYKGLNETVPFEIKRVDNNLTLDKSQYDVAYGDGDFTIEYILKESADLIYSSDNTNAATVDENGKVHIIGKGEAHISVTAEESTNYNKDTKTVTVNVNPVNMDDCKVSLELYEYTYNGTAKEPEVEVKLSDKTLTKDTDYEVSYKNNEKAGTATVIITGTGNVTGTKTEEFTIEKATETPNKPSKELTPEHKIKIVSEVELPAGWQWLENDESKELADNEPVTATAKYVGSDAGNYETESVEITITRQPCTHTGGTATCIAKAVCELCGLEYGDVVKTHELEKTEKVAATCTEKGKAAYWTCSVCKKIFADENGTQKVEDESTLVIAATGHNWNEEYTIDKEPTATESGNKSIHCKDCDAIQEGSSVEIPATGNDNTSTEGSGNTSTGGNDNTSTEGSGNVSTGGNDNTSTGGSGNTITGGNDNTNTEGSGNTITGGNNNTSTEGSGNISTGGNDNTSTEGSGNTITGENDNTTSGGSGNTTPSGNGSTSSSTGGGNTSSTPASSTSTTTPVKGEAVTDATTKGVYTISTVADSSAGKTGTVEYNKPANSAGTSVNIPATIQIGGKTYKVTAIGEGAFENDKTITRVTIGSNVTTIGKKAFSGCIKLKTVTIGKNVTTIGDKAFAKCIFLTKIIIPAKVTKIGKNAFSGCKKLKTIIIKSKKLTKKSVAKNAFKGISSKTTIKVPKSKLKAYKKLFRSKGLSKKVKIK